MKKAWVYVLECTDKSYYTGVTSDLKKRLTQHKTGYYKDSYTASRLPVNLLWSQEFSDIKEAIEAEKRIKGWSRKKKKALFEGDFNLIHEFAQSKEMVERRKKRSSTPSFTYAQDCAQTNIQKRN